MKNIHVMGVTFPPASSSAFLVRFPLAFLEQSSHSNEWMRQIIAGNVSQHFLPVSWLFILERKCQRIGIELKRNSEAV